MTSRSRGGTRRRWAAAGGSLLVLAGLPFLSGCAGAAGSGSAGGSGSALSARTDVDPALVRAAHLPPCPASPSGNPTAGPSAGSPAGDLPDLQLPCLGEGPAVNLSGLRGRPVVLNAWASWCEPCRREIPVFQAYASAGRSRPAERQVLVLGVDVTDDPNSALVLARQLGMSYPSLWDGSGRVRPAFAISALPQTLFIAGDGRIRHRSVAPITTLAELRSLAAEHLTDDQPADRSASGAG